jgi:tyrosine-protein phosphatase SIW14
VLYRSGQTSLAGLKRLIHDYGIRTVVTLRDAHVPGRPPPDQAEEDYCRKEDIRYVRIPPRNWWAPAGPAPVQVGVDRFLEVMRDPDNHPVLVHCFAGIHRTGAYCAIYRMEFDGWTNTEALEEMRACGYDTLDEEWDILGYLENYRPTKKIGTGVLSDPRIAQD